MGKTHSKRSKRFPFWLAVWEMGSWWLNLDFFYLSSKDSSYGRCVTHGCGSADYILQSFRLSTEGCCLDKEIWLLQSPAQLCQFKLLRSYIQLSPSGSNKTKAKYTNPSLRSQRPSYASAEQGELCGSLQLLTSCLCHAQMRFNKIISAPS